MSRHAAEAHVAEALRNNRDIKIGKRGGRYYIATGGKRVYISDPSMLPKESGWGPYSNLRGSIHQLDSTERATTVVPSAAEALLKHGHLEGFVEEAHVAHAVRGRPESDFGYVKNHDAWTKKSGQHAYVDELSESDKGAIANYTSSNYRHINGALGKGHMPDDPDLASAVTRLDHVLANAPPIDRDIKLGRYTGMHAIPQELHHAALNDPQSLAGTVIRHPAFGSTGTDQGTAVGSHGNVRIEYLVPKGTRGPLSVRMLGEREEKEVLLPRNHSFAIRRAHRLPDGTLELVAEYIPPEG